jgi:hypothetical protein
MDGRAASIPTLVTHHVIWPAACHIAIAKVATKGLA